MIGIRTPTFRLAARRLNQVRHRVSRVRADSHYASRFRSIYVPSKWSVFTLSVVFSHFPARHVKGGLRLFPSNMQQPFVFQKTAAIALVLDKEDKYVALSAKKKRMWVHKCF